LPAQVRGRLPRAHRFRAPDGAAVAHRAHPDADGRRARRERPAACRDRDAAFVISSHVVAMFAPSFFTGRLIRRFGVVPVMLSGAALSLACIGAALAGLAVANFWWSMVLLGVGWNFLYIGGTTLLTDTYRPEERAKAQGANDQAIFIVMVISSLTSGMTVTSAGWERVNLMALPLIALVAAALVWFALHQRTRSATA